MKKFIKILKNKDGIALVMLALMSTVLLGFSALAVDVGMIAYTKSKLQSVADAAALAGAHDLPSAATAKSTAISYAGLNEVESSEIMPTTPYDGDSKKIEVVCTRTVQYTFAKILGLTQTDVSARAVAKNNDWDGEALPFINLDNYDEEDEDEILSGWDHVSPGDKERIHNDDLTISSNSIKVNIEDGTIMFKKGKDLSGVADPLKVILREGNTVYMFGLSNDKVGEDPYDKLDNKQLIPLSDTVVFKCTVVGNYEKNNDKISLRLEQVYNYDEEIEGFDIDDEPPNLVE
ncbi:pilus assembly protein TadG-related protein [Peptoclostridium acidaminophilum]|nr:pilus assembly protein TadG-related protein [Peptoclostridium acidaminophilum]